MDENKVFATIGVPPTDDFNTIRKAHRARLRELTKEKREAEGDYLEELEGKLLDLNEAFNVVTEYRGSLTQLKLRAESQGEVRKKQTTGIPKKEIEINEDGMPANTQALRDIMREVQQGHYREPEINNRGRVSKETQGVIEDITLKWKEYTLPIVHEEITFIGYHNGTKVILDDDNRIEIPPKFLGVLSRMVDGKILCVNVTPKNSLVFNYNTTGDLTLKRLPKNTTFKDGIISFNFASSQFNIDLNKAERVSAGKDGKIEVLIMEGQGVTPHGSTTAGYMIVNPLILEVNKSDGIDQVLEDILEFIG